MMDAKNYTARETLKNGLNVTVRSIRPDDRDEFTAALNELDERSVYLRFFTNKKNFSDKELTLATDVDFVNIIALVTCFQDKEDEKIIGGARYFAFGDAIPPDKAEVSFTVRNGFQGLGMAGLMLRQLASIAREMGIKAFYAEVLKANTGMLTVFKQSGFPMKLDYESDVVHVMLDIGKSI
jgi:RimJ/RimL family protein N-acetyltransferase